MKSCFVQFLFLGKCFGLFFCREAGHVGIADRIFLGHTQGIFLALGLGHLRQVGLFGRRYDVQGIGKHVTRTVGEGKGHFLFLAERNFFQSETLVGRSIYQHVAQSGRKRGFALRVSRFVGYGEELSVIINLELYMGTFHSLSQ